jgi:hypothetical protein
MIVDYNFSPIIGDDRSTQFDPATIRNVFITKSDASGRIGWHDFPGLKKISTDTSPERGMHVMSEERYIVTSTTLYKEANGGNRTSIGTIAGSARCTFADDGTNLLIANGEGGKVYKYDGSTLSDITSSLPSAIGAPRWVDFFYNTFVAGSDTELATSDTGDPDTWNALNTTPTDQASDNLVRGYIFNSLLYAFGNTSTELWLYSGSGSPPIDRRGSTLTNVGIAGRYAVSNSDSYLYFLGDDRRAYKGSGSSVQPVNTASVSSIIDDYVSVSDCIVSSFTLKGQVFVMFKFPSAGDCLVYSETNDYWLTLSSGTDRYTRKGWYGNAVHNCYGKNLSLDATSGHSYELDFDTLTDNGDTRLRILTGNPITGAVIGKPQNQISVDAIHIPMQRGVSLETGQGSTAQIIFELSPNGGQIYNQQDLVNIGDYDNKVIIHQFCTGYEIVPRIMISDPVPLTVFSGGSANVNDAGY